MNRLSTLGFFAAFALVATHALADDVPSDARTIARAKAQEGDAAFAVGRCDKAVPLWIEADHAFAASTIELRIAHCQALLGRVVDATKTLETIAHATLAPDAPQPLVDAKTQAESELPSMRERIATLDLKAHIITAITEISIDDVGYPVDQRSFQVDPGRHRIHLRAQSAEAEHVIEFKDGEHKSLSFETKLVEPPPPPHVVRNTGIALGGVGVASLVAGAIFGVDALHQKSTLDGNCPTRASCPSTDQDTITALKRNSVLSDIFLGGGVVFIGVGSFLFVTDAKTEHPAAQPQIVFTAGGASLRGTF